MTTIPELTATCATDGCPNAGVGVNVPAYAELDGERHDVERVICGACGNDVADVVPAG